MINLIHLLLDHGEFLLSQSHCHSSAEIEDALLMEFLTTFLVFPCFELSGNIQLPFLLYQVV